MIMMNRVKQLCPYIAKPCEALSLAKYVHHPVKHFSSYDNDEQSGTTLPIQSEALQSSQSCEVCTPSSEVFLQL